MVAELARRIEHPRPDEEIIRECQADPRTCGPFQERYFSSILEKARRLTKDNQQAQELARDVITHLIDGGLRTYNASKGSLEGWLYTVVHNAYIDRTRKAKREIPVGEIYEGAAVTTRTPEDLVEQKQLRERIEKALSGLPQEQREALLMFELEGLSYEEIAARQGVSQGTVMSRLSRAREKARDALALLHQELKKAA